MAIFTIFAWACYFICLPVLAQDLTKFLSGPLPFASVLMDSREPRRSDYLPWLKQPLWGVTYVPFRKSMNCSNVSKEDILKDLRSISTIAFQVYVPEMYCEFGSIIAEATNRLELRLVLGVTLKSKEEFRLQFDKLEKLFKGHSNLSHVSAISVGWRQLANYVNDPAFVNDTLDKVKKLIKQSNYSRINVTSTDIIPYLFDRPWTSRLDAYIVLVVNSVTQKPVDLLEQARKSSDHMKKYSDVIDEYQKRVYIAGIGWPSSGRTVVNGNSKIDNGSLQAQFVEDLICAAHKRDIGLRYFYSYAFDPLWVSQNESNQRNLGLFDGETRGLKSHLANALNGNCTIGTDPDLDVPEEVIPIHNNPENAKGGSNTTMIIGLSVGSLVILIILMILLMVFLWKRKRQADNLRMVLAERHLSSTGNSGANSSTGQFSKNRQEEYIGMIEIMYADLRQMMDVKHVIAIEDLEFKEIIGEGHFGVVQRATLKTDDENIEVAVKRLHDGGTNVRQFILEGLRMENFHHPNVLHLIGICYASNIPMIVVPYMAKDNLLNFVKNRFNKLTVRRVLEFASEIASGMEYLHGLRLVHRDLAARNCMLDSSLSVKISDFGLCRDISETDSYQATRTFELPVRWMAPETILKLIWTNKSDVWSYAVVIWELMTRGQQPYSDIHLIELRIFLEQGGRLSKPRYSPDIIYDFMKTCWHREPDNRPEFDALRKTLTGIIQAVDDNRIGGVDAYYNAITILENESTQKETTADVEF